MPLTHKTGGPVDPVVEEIAATRRLTPSQVLQMWALKKGVVVVTTGSKQERMAESIQASRVAAGSGPYYRGNALPLSDEDVSRIDEAGEKLAYRKYWQKEFGSEMDWQRPNHSLT